MNYSTKSTLSLLGGLMMSFFLCSTLNLNAQMQERTESGAALELRGKIWSGAGQAGTTGFDGFENYWDIAPAHQKPNIFMDYYDTWNMHPRWSKELKQELMKYHRQGYYVLPQFGINVFYLWQQYLDGSQDDELDNLVEGLKYLGMPCFIRIGYEFNNFPGVSWLTPYTPEQFAEVYRVIAKKIKDSGIECALVFNASLSGKQGVFNYYPGDDYVDWIGFNTFSSDIAGGKHSTAMEMIDTALVINKPILIGEAGTNAVNGADNSKDWSFYETYFSMIEDQPTIKQMCYINWDWDGQDMIGGNGLFPWGDGRLQIPGAVKDQFFNRIDNDKYFFAASEKETRALFFYDDKQAPNQVTGLRRVGENLVWDKVTDNGEAGIAHYTIYKDGKMWDYIMGEEYPIHDLYYGYDSDIQVLAMDRAGNESPLSEVLKVNLDNRYELIWDGEFDYPATSVAVDWKWVGSKDAGAKNAPDDIIIDTSGQLSGQNSCYLPDHPLTDNMGNYWAKEITYEPRDWKLQLSQTIQVVEGEEYTITFQIKAREERTIMLYFMDHHVNPQHDFVMTRDGTYPHWMDGKNGDWDFYDIWEVQAGPEPKTYTFKSTAPETSTARLSFMMGRTKPTDMWIDAVSVSCGLDIKDPVPVIANETTIIDTDNSGSETVTLDGSQSSDSDGNIVSYVWKNGQTVIGNEAVVTVDLPAGKHTITLGVTDNDNNYAERSKDFMVTNGEPIADAGADQFVVDSDDSGAEEVILNGSNSKDYVGSIVSYKWTEGSTVISNEMTATVSLSTGKHMLTLEVTDDEGNVDTDEVAIEVVPDVSADATVTASSTGEGSAAAVIDNDLNSGWTSALTEGSEWVMLDLGASRDIIGIDLDWGKEYATDYEIQVSDNASFSSFDVVAAETKGNGSTDVFAFDPSVIGQYVRVMMTESSDKGNEVIDGTGNFKAVISPDVPPTITFIPLKDGMGTGFCYLDLNVNGSDLGGYQVTLNEPYTVNAKVGDVVKFKYRYTSPGGAQIESRFTEFTVGEVTTGYVYALNEIKVYSSTAVVGLPVANAGADQTLVDEDNDGVESVTLDGSASSDDGTITSYSWSSNGSVIAESATATVDFAVGTHNVTLTVTDNDGNVRSDAVVIKVVKPQTMPVAPSNLEATEVSSVKVVLVWSDNSDNEDNFEVVKDGVVVATLDANTTTYTDKDVQAETTYTYGVNAVNTKGTAESTTISATTPAASDNCNAITDAYEYSVTQAAGSTQLNIVFDSKVSSSFVDLWVAVNSDSFQGTRGNKSGDTWTWTLANKPDGTPLAEGDVVKFYFRYQHNYNPGQSDTPEGAFEIGTGCVDAKKAIFNAEFKPEVFVYPNPANGSLTINGVDKNSDYIITNMFGSVVKKDKGNKVDVSDLNAGIYIMTVEGKVMPVVIK